MDGYGTVYGPALAKRLARSTQGGALAASTNNDNNVYFAISRYMMQKFNVPYPQLPTYNGKPPKVTDIADFQDSITIDKDPVVIPNGTYPDDADFYGNLTLPATSTSPAPSKTFSATLAVIRMGHTVSVVGFRKVPTFLSQNKS